VSRLFATLPENSRGDFFFLLPGHEMRKENEGRKSKVQPVDFDLSSITSMGWKLEWNPIYY